MNPQLVGGDDWEFRITLLDQAGAPYDLSGNPPFEWVLADRSGIHVLHTTDVSIAMTDAAAGKISVMVGAAKTATLSGGTYRQSLRMEIGGITHTPLVAAIDVLVDPFREPAEPTPAAPLLAFSRGPQPNPKHRRATWPK